MVQSRGKMVFSSEVMNRMVKTVAFWAVLVGLVSLAGRGNCAIKAEELPRGMFELYEQNRTEGIPNYITEDFILLAYSMTLNEAITELEEEVLYPQFRDLIKSLLAKVSSVKKRDEMTRQLLDYLCVTAVLLGEDESSLPIADREAVAGELARIESAQGVAASDLMLQKFDYSQFKVRGKYTRSEALSRYFAAVKYAGTVMFPVLESKATEITAKQADRLTGAALILAKLVFEDKKLLNQYEGLNNTLTHLFGPSEELSLQDSHQIDGKLKDASPAKKREALLELARSQGRQPRIFSYPVNLRALEKGRTAADVLTGWRLLPQRFTPDAAAFQYLVYDRVKSYQGKKQPFSLVKIDGLPVKGFPLAIELMAILDSKQAQRILQDFDETNYKEYANAAARAGEVLKKPCGLPSDHLRLIDFWLTADDTQPAENRRLNSCLAFWTYQRYISVLYTKQSYTMVGKSLALHSPRKTAWIEPAPELYLRLQKQVRELQSVLPSERLKELEKVLERCRAISSMELEKKPLDKDEVSFLNDLDQKLLPLTGGKDHPVAVDVHTELNSGFVLQEAIGYPSLVEKKLDAVKARGALFSYYEFKHALDNRLNDAEWQAILDDPKRLKALDMSPGSGLLRQ